MSEEEAQAFLDEFVATAPERLAAFRREVAATGGPQLDPTQESLIGLWEWFVRRHDAGRPEEEAPLPAWYEPDPPETAGERLAPATLADADGIALHLADVFRHESPQLEWGLGKMPKRMLYEAQHRPVLKGGLIDVDPLTVAYTLAARVALMGRGRESGELLHAYRAWLPALQTP